VRVVLMFVFLCSQHTPQVAARVRAVRGEPDEFRFNDRLRQSKREPQYAKCEARSRLKCRGVQFFVGFVDGVGLEFTRIRGAEAVAEEGPQQGMPTIRQRMMNDRLRHEHDAVTGGAEPDPQIGIESAEEILAFGPDLLEHSPRDRATAMASEVAVGDAIDHGHVETRELGRGPFLKDRCVARHDDAGAGHADRLIRIEGADKPFENAIVCQTSVVVEDDKNITPRVSRALVDGLSLRSYAFDDVDLIIPKGLMLDAGKESRQGPVPVSVEAWDDDGDARSVVWVDGVMHLRSLEPYARPRYHGIAAQSSRHRPWNPGYRHGSRDVTYPLSYGIILFHTLA